MSARRSSATELTGWGRYPRVRGNEVPIHDPLAVPDGLTLSRGLGRSYGDASLPRRSAPEERAPSVGQWRTCDRVLRFDPATGRIRCEAGLSLKVLIEIVLPHGWFVPVSPGTASVTIGGMVACDVHGKNHHRAGTFGAHLSALRLQLPAGGTVEVSPQREADVFWATVGGCGLTGHIVEVEFDLIPISSPWLIQQSVACPDWDTLWECQRSSAVEWPYTAAWADLRAVGGQHGRGIVFRARWAEPSERFTSRPPSPPRPIAIPWLPKVGPLTSRLFNAAYYRLSRWKQGTKVVSPAAVFHPLDRVNDWPRFYGRAGFAQYQCVVPGGSDVGEQARSVIAALRDEGAVLSLAVIKDCGPEGNGLLSFPREGLSLALDFPILSPDHAQTIHDRANEVLLGCGGRVYLAKDAFTRREHFEAMEPRLEEWRRIRARLDPERRLASALGDRLLEAR